MKIERHNKLPFLDVLVARKSDGSLVHQVDGGCWGCSFEFSSTCSGPNITGKSSGIKREPLKNRLPFLGGYNSPIPHNVSFTDGHSRNCFRFTTLEYVAHIECACTQRRTCVVKPEPAVSWQDALRPRTRRREKRVDMHECVNFTWTKRCARSPGSNSPL